MTKQQTLRLVGAVYGGVLLCSLLASVCNFVVDCIDRAGGAMQTHKLTTFLQFERQDIEPVLEISSGAVASTTSEDPQLLLENLTADGSYGKVRTVSFSIAYTKDPGEVTLYYAGAGQPFDKDKKVWGKQQNDGSYTFALPRMQTDIDRLRVDPTNQKGVTMTLGSVVLNAPRTLGSYFMPTYESVFRYFVYTGLAAALLGYVLTQFGTQLQALGARLRCKARNTKPQ